MGKVVEKNAILLENIRKTRKSLGLSQEIFFDEYIKPYIKPGTKAEKIKSKSGAQGFISKLERGYREFPADLLPAYANAAECTIEELFKKHDGNTFDYGEPTTSEAQIDFNTVFSVIMMLVDSKKIDYIKISKNSSNVIADSMIYENREYSTDASQARRVMLITDDDLYKCVDLYFSTYGTMYKAVKDGVMDANNSGRVLQNVFEKIMAEHRNVSLIYGSSLKWMYGRIPEACFKDDGFSSEWAKCNIVNDEGEPQDENSTAALN